MNFIDFDEREIKENGRRKIQERGFHFFERSLFGTGSGILFTELMSGILQKTGGIDFQERIFFNFWRDLIWEDFWFLFAELMSGKIKENGRNRFLGADFI
jgi:hypothetical protein